VAPSSLAESSLEEIKDFLPCNTPDAWIDAALQNQDVLLIDHANCEKKAASTAINLIYRYVDDFELLNKMSKLAREEMRHFEQVIAIMKARGIEYQNISASRYAAGLRKKVRTHEPAKLIDTLIVGAFIEARSCERFAKLAPFLDDELKQFYLSLLKSEGRHYRDYLSLAKKAAGGKSIDERISIIREQEQALIEAPDNEFHFHSGPPAALTIK
jgi:tRNA 2-(methylsulfanyl)-N6-isopentenyladenosine37 hydroxylase